EMQRSAIDMPRAAAACFDQRQQLGPVAWPELDDARDRRRLPQTRAAMCVEQAELRAGDAVPRQFADGIEQRRPERIVQIARRKLPGFERQVVFDIAGKLFKIERDVL